MRNRQLPEGILLNPECRDGKHTNCDSIGFDENSLGDPFVDCPCDCHIPNSVEVTERWQLDMLPIGAKVIGFEGRTSQKDLDGIFKAKGLEVWVSLPALYLKEAEDV